MQRATRLLIAILSVGLPLTVSSSAHAACPSGTVASGSACIDRYEASLWRVTNQNCVNRIKAGSAFPPACVAVSVQLGINGVDYTDAQCQFNGGGCTNIFALSLPGVTPAHTINYFIAAAACRNSAKRLPSNAEWQAAALGTPDPWPQDDPANQCNLEGASTTTHGRPQQVRLRRGRLRHGRQRHRVRGRLGPSGHNGRDLGRVHPRASAATSATWAEARTARSTACRERPCGAGASRSLRTAAEPASGRACTPSTRTAHPTASAMPRRPASGARSSTARGEGP